jgi:hypothetical protein
VPRHAAPLVAGLIASLVVDYSSSRRLVVDYFSSAARPVPQYVARLVTQIIARLVVDYLAYAARLGASARRAANRLSSTTAPTPRDRVPRYVARLVAWLVVPLLVDYSASRRLVVDYFASAAGPGASARRATRRVARCVARCAARRRLLRLA